MTSTTLQENLASTQAAQDEAAIRALIAGIHQAHLDKIGAAIAAPYAADAVVYNLAPPLVHVGRDASEIQAWLDTWATPIELEARDMNIAVSGDLAYCHCLLHMSGTKETDEGSVRFWMRETVCLQRASGQWRIVHEHTSVPFYMDGSLRPAFDLEP
jgi:ketosteroid isomerase-like protein